MKIRKLNDSSRTNKPASYWLVLIRPVIPPGANVGNNMNLVAAKFDPWWFYDMVKKGGPWDFKKRNSKYKVCGNLNYGACGAAMGWPDSVLFREANRAQLRDVAGWKPECGTHGPLWNPFGSTCRDSKDCYWTEKGIEFYHQTHRTKPALPVHSWYLK